MRKYDIKNKRNIGIIIVISVIIIVMFSLVISFFLNADKKEYTAQLYLLLYFPLQVRRSACAVWAHVKGKTIFCPHFSSVHSAASSVS